jgi:hypothetical protein
VVAARPALAVLGDDGPGIRFRGEEAEGAHGVRKL